MIAHVILLLAATPSPAPSVVPLSVPSANASAGPTPKPTAIPSPAKGASPAASASPVASASPGASAAPSPVPSSSSSPYKYRFIPQLPAQPAAGQPLIYAVYLNDSALRSRGPIQIKVVTTPDVVKVTSGGGGRSGVIPRIATGDFETSSTLPPIPFLARGVSVDLLFTATNVSGKTFTVDVPVKVR